MRPRTETVDGLEFEVPTWDPTPVPWNDRGSWATDPELEARLLDGIRAAVPNHAELVAEALTARLTDGTEDWCRTFWGSHGCDRPAGHDGLHVCNDCSAGLKYGDGDTLILWWADEDEGFRLSFHHWRWFE